MKTTLGLSLLLASALPGMGQGILYDHSPIGTPEPYNGTWGSVFAGKQSWDQDFTDIIPQQSGTVTGGTVWFLASAPGSMTTLSNVVYAPGYYPYVSFGGTTLLNQVQTGRSIFDLGQNWQELAITFTFDNPYYVEAGVDYWFGISGRTDPAAIMQWEFSNGSYAMQLYGTPIPEPSTFVLAGIGLAVLVIFQSRRQSTIHAGVPMSCHAVTKIGR